MSSFWSALYPGRCTGVGARWSERSGSSLTDSASPHGKCTTFSSRSSNFFVASCNCSTVFELNLTRFQSVWWLSSVPDLSEYRVWLGVSDIWSGSPDSFKRQEISIAHVICGPEGSSLALIRLSQWVPEDQWCVHLFLHHGLSSFARISFDQATFSLHQMFAGLPDLQTMSTQSSSL